VFLVLKSEEQKGYAERYYMKDLLIGLDLGTSALKGVLISASGDIIAQDKVSTCITRPEPGYVEVSAEKHYSNVCALIRILAEKVPEGSQVRALSMAAASGNTLLAGADGEPLTPIINWMDTRVKERIEEYMPGLDAKGVYPVVGWPFSGTFPLAHLAWFRKEQPDAYRKASHICMNSDYILYKLTGKWGMDYSTATTFFLQDQMKREFYEPFLKMLGIDEEQLSPLSQSGTVLGPLTKQAAQDTGLDTDTLTVLGAFDHPCAARGTGSVEPGDLLMSCGTSWVGFFPVMDRDRAISQNLLIDPFLSPDGPWGTMFSFTGIGVAIDRYIDEIIIDDVEEAHDKYFVFSSMAEKAQLGAGGLILSLEGDTNKALEQGHVLKDTYSRENISRAVMEGAAFLMRRKIEDLAEAGIQASNITMVGGPAESPVWPQILADVTGLEFRIGFGQTAGALGSAVLAGVGSGVFKGLEHGYTSLTCDVKTIIPDQEAHREYSKLAEE